MGINIESLSGPSGGIQDTDEFLLIRPGATVPYNVTSAALKAYAGAASNGLPVEATYTASGAINLPTGNVALIVVNSAATCAMTLANGVIDGQVLYIKRYGAGAVTVTLNLDGASGAVITANSSTIKEMVKLIWNVSLSTWIAG